VTREEAIACFEDLERIHAAASTDWRRGMTPSGEGMLARLIPAQEPQPVLTFDPWADRGDLAFVEKAHAGMGFLIRLVKSLKRRIEELEGPPSAPPPEPPNHAANCAIYCDKPAFQRFLTECHGLQNQNSDATASRVRSILNIRSRAELNDNPAAAEGWKKLRGEFYAWKQLG
jgi:hypothetical protein